MSLKKFEELRQQRMKKYEEEMARIQEEEDKERQKRVAPLVSRYTTLFQDILTKALNDRVEELEGAKFRKTNVRKRLEDAIEVELAALIGTDGEDDADAENADITEDSKDTSKDALSDSAAPQPPASAGGDFFSPNGDEDSQSSGVSATTPSTF